MSKKQKNILVGVIIMIVAMLVYPPFQYTGEGGIVTNMGYDWIYDPPHYLGRYNAQAIVNVPVLLVQWLGIILVGGLVLYLAKDNPESGQKTVPVETHTKENEDSNSHAHFTGNPASSTDAAQARGPVGVGGWLLLLITGLMIFGPLLGAGRLYGEIMTLERTYPNLISVSEWSTYKSAVGWIFLGSAAISFWGGLRLSREKYWSAVENAIAALWISGPGAAVVLGVLVPLIIFGKASLPDSDIFVGLFWSVIASSIWTAYLLKSKRVRNTFQNNAVNESAITNDKELQYSQASPRKLSGSESTKISILDIIVGLSALGFLLLMVTNSFTPSQQTPAQSQTTNTPPTQTPDGTVRSNQAAISAPKPAGNIEPQANEVITAQSRADAITSQEKVAPKLPAKYVAKSTAPSFLKPGQLVTVYEIAGRWARLSTSEPQQWVELVHLRRAK